MENFIDALNKYFAETPREKVLEDWNKSAEWDNVGPTMDEFLDNTRQINKQLKKYHAKFLDEVYFSEFIEKVKLKYESDAYKDRYYNNGVMPSEDLYWFLYEYAKKYGRECDEEEFKKYGNQFTSGLYYINGYYFNRMDGQGSIIKITKK